MFGVRLFLRNSRIKILIIKTEYHRSVAAQGQKYGGFCFVLFLTFLLVICESSSASDCLGTQSLGYPNPFRIVYCGPLVLMSVRKVKPPPVFFCCVLVRSPVIPQTLSGKIEFFGSNIGYSPLLFIPSSAMLLVSCILYCSWFIAVLKICSATNIVHIQ